MEYVCVLGVWVGLESVKLAVAYFTNIKSNSYKNTSIYQIDR